MYFLFLNHFIMEPQKKDVPTHTNPDHVERNPNNGEPSSTGNTPK